MENTVTVIIPVYNGEKYLEQCLNSLINQDYENIKIVVVNDASSDNSVEIIEEFIKKDSRVTLINNKENRGVAYARNSALKNLDTDYFCFVDCDDWVEPSYVSTLVNLYDDSTVLTSCYYRKERRNYKHIKNKKSKISGYTAKTAMGEAFSDKGISLFVWNKMFKTSLLGDICFDEKAVTGEDVLFVLNYLSNCKDKGNVKFTSQKLYHYLKIKNSLSSLSCNKEKFYKQKPFFENFEKLKLLPDIAKNNDLCEKINSWLFLVALQFVFYARKVHLGNEKKYFKNYAKMYLLDFKKQRKIYKAIYRRQGIILYYLIKIFI